MICDKEPKNFIKSSAKNIESNDINHLVAMIVNSLETEETSLGDGVRLYMGDMGKYALLTREDEIRISKQMEKGVQQMMKNLSIFHKEIIENIIEMYNNLDEENLQSSVDFIAGFFESVDDETKKPVKETKNTNIDGSETQDLESPEDDTTEEEPTLDKELIDSHFKQLINDYENLLKEKEKPEFDIKAYNQAQSALSNTFIKFRLPTKLMNKYKDISQKYKKI